MASMNILGNLGAVSQLGIAGMNNQTRTNAPFINAGLDDIANTASGNRTFTPSGGGGAAGGGGGMPSAGANDPANTVPLPTDTPLPAVAGAPTPAATPRPGAQAMTPAQWDAMNADLVRRGRQSRGPYPY
jgi:hypothetical protein